MKSIAALQFPSCRPKFWQFAEDRLSLSWAPVTMSPMSFTRFKLGNTHSKKGKQDGKQRVPQFLHVLWSPSDVWARQCVVLRLVCHSSHCSSHRCPRTTYYDPCVCQDTTWRDTCTSVPSMTSHRGQSILPTGVLLKAPSQNWVHIALPAFLSFWRAVCPH